MNGFVTLYQTMNGRRQEVVIRLSSILYIVNTGNDAVSIHFSGDRKYFEEGYEKVMEALKYGKEH